MKRLWNPAEREVVQEGNAAAERSSILVALVSFLKWGENLPFSKSGYQSLSSLTTEYGISAP